MSNSKYSMLIIFASSSVLISSCSGKKPTKQPAPLVRITNCPNKDAKGNCITKSSGNMTADELQKKITSLEAQITKLNADRKKNIEQIKTLEATAAGYKAELKQKKTTDGGTTDEKKPAQQGGTQPQPQPQQNQQESTDRILAFLLKQKNQVIFKLRGEGRFASITAGKLYHKGFSSSSLNQNFTSTPLSFSTDKFGDAFIEASVSDTKYCGSVNLLRLLSTNEKNPNHHVNVTDKLKKDKSYDSNSRGCEQ